MGKLHTKYGILKWHMKFWSCDKGLAERWFKLVGSKANEKWLE